MSELGRHLQELRERKGVSLEDIARVTRIGRAQLAALEAEDFSELPAPIFVKGFIRSYCGALHESSEQALELYLRSRAEAVRTPPALLDTPLFRPRRRRPVVAAAVFLLVLLAGGVLALRVVPRQAAAPPEPVGVVSTMAARGPIAAAPGPPAPVPAAIPDATPAASAPVSAAAPAEPATASMEAPGGSRAVATPASGHHLVARTTEPTWVRVQMDGGEVVQELLPAGVTREWTAERRFVLTIGNAGGIALELDGRPLPALETRRGVVRELVLPGEDLGKPRS